MIGGNTKAILQVSTTTKNIIGEPVKAWVDVIELLGWLDYQSGDAKHSTYNAKIQESTHIFVGDYKEIPETILINGKEVEVNSESTRLLEVEKNGKKLRKPQEYDVLLIDNPMELNKQLEIYLKYVGGQ